MRMRKAMIKRIRRRVFNDTANYDNFSSCIIAPCVSINISVTGA